MMLNQLEEALQCWLEICENALFDEPVPLGVMREAWLSELDQPALNHQFVSGGVTFCTLMPMRAVPFKVVCLLGMNDGDFPRRGHQSDFDLLALPGMARPGDRSRRDDDRYLMLEALLAARDKLYVSWVGRNVRDNTEQPASVLVSQLRDYLAPGWDLDLDERTTVHALQPFSRRYFERGGLLTYAGEWRSAHRRREAPDDAGGEAMPCRPTSWSPTTASSWASWRPSCASRRATSSGAAWASTSAATRWWARTRNRSRWMRSNASSSKTRCWTTAANRKRRPRCARCWTLRAGRLVREGRLPIGLVGKQWQQQLVEDLVPVRRSWLALGARYPRRRPSWRSAWTWAACCSTTGSTSCAATMARPCG
jgi:exodeoxyribonuclease V gamma subunit